jgi:hypothetical protein
MITQKSHKSRLTFNCEPCHYVCSNRCDYNKHMFTRKHQINVDELQKISVGKHICNCGKEYLYRQGLYAHKKKCINPSINENIVVQDASNNDIVQLLIKENSDFKHIIIDLVKSNTDLQKQMVDVYQKIQPASSASSTSSINSHNNTTNSHNKTFNLNFFLNEQCKDAMNINDFIKSIKIEVSDLERLGKEGYVEGFSRIILEKLKEMNIYKRPLHCSDAKRETMYIKDNDVWNKDESPNNEKMIEFIKAVEQRNYTSLLAYADEYPEVYKQESKRNVPYLHMAMQSNGTAEKINKVIKRIIKEVVINKDCN